MDDPMHAVLDALYAMESNVDQLAATVEDERIVREAAPAAEETLPAVGAPPAE